MTIRPARSADFDNAFDPLWVAGDEGVLFSTPQETLAGQGEAVRLELSYQMETLDETLACVTRMLADLPTEPGSDAPVAFVSVPFAPTRPLLALVPEFTVRQSQSRGLGQAKNKSQATRLTAFTEGSLPTGFPPPLIMEPPSSYDIHSSRAPKQWCDAVGDAIALIHWTELNKVALARELIIEADAPFSQYRILQELERAHPTAYRFAIDGLVGASPELLVERRGDRVCTQPLAGTVARSGDVSADQAACISLMRSGKERAEHRFLVDMVRDTLTPFCDELIEPPIPEVLSLTNVHHLATTISGRLQSPAANVLQLVAALHPTPAVGGCPTQLALDVINDLEELDRGRYAGAVGWVDANGDGQFVIAIRCAQLEGCRGRIYAGNGIVAASNPEKELAETQAKFQVMLAALIRP